jgi:hypothetical protein
MRSKRSSEGISSGCRDRDQNLVAIVKSDEVHVVDVVWMAGSVRGSWFIKKILRLVKIPFGFQRHHPNITRPPALAFGGGRVHKSQS